MSNHAKKSLAVVPTLRRDPDQLLTLKHRLGQAGVHVNFVVTGRKLHDALTARGISHLTPEANPGFSASIHFGADASSWDWLFIINDDITIAEAFSEVVSDLETLDPNDLHLVFIDPERRRSLPQLSTVFTSIALFDAVLSKIRSSRSTSAEVHDDWYKSFSCVAISRQLWDRLGGLDRRFPYTYEDADFTRRAREAGAQIHEVTEQAVRHEGSGTSRRFIGGVLPVGTYSALEYLVSLGHKRSKARAVVLAGLIARMALSPLADADFKDHLRGVAASMSAVFKREAPRLPLYEEN